MSKRWLGCGVAVLAGWVVPGAAVAATERVAHLSGTSITDHSGASGFTYDARFGATDNDVTVTFGPDGQTATITDPGVTIIAEPGTICSGGDGVGTCTAAGGITGGSVYAGDGDDRVSFAGNDAYNFLYGGAGDDTLIAGSTRASLLSGGGGNDVLRGGAGDDSLEGGPGADDLSGGAGRDDANYSDEKSSVTLSLDDVANDGAPGEGDDIHTDVEMAGAVRFDAMTGDPVDPPGGDTIIGDDAANYLETSNGPARVEGLGGDDTLVVVNSKQASTLDGGDGNDQLEGLDAADTLIGGNGDDVLNSVDHAPDDTLNCGAGNDLAHLNPGDATDGCETLDSITLPPEPDGLVTTPQPEWQCWIYPALGSLGGPTPTGGPFCPT